MQLPGQGIWSIKHGGAAPQCDGDGENRGVSEGSSATGFFGQAIGALIPSIGPTQRFVLDPRGNMQV